VRKKIKPIISNPRGHNIHSPFAFNLVTEVIFKREKGGWFLFKRKHEVNSYKDKIFNLLKRLIEFLSPERIVIFGRDSNDFAVQSKGILVLRITEVTGPEKKFNPAAGDLVVWLESPSAEVNISAPDVDNVWFLYGLREAGMHDFFEKLKSDDNVRQTYEFNSCGIVIFNPKFQKEDFVIKENKSY
jgi:hypothetical protein